MPKRAPIDDTIDPVRSRLAAQASTAIAPNPPVKPRLSVGAVQPKSQDEEEGGQTPPKKRNGPVQYTVNRKAMFTQEEADRNEEIQNTISRAFGSKVGYSHVTRAFWAILAGAEETMMGNRVRRSVRLSPPQKGNYIAMAEYEDALADFLREVLKRELRS